MPVLKSGLTDLTIFLDNFERRMGVSVQNAVVKYGMDLYSSIIHRSPVDTGQYKTNWYHDVINGSGNTIIEFRISNRLPYAGPVSYGSLVGKRPWPSAGPKTVVNKGRVFSKQAPIGVIDPAFDSLPIEKLQREILKALTG